MGPSSPTPRTVEELIAEGSSLFREVFGCSPQWAAVAPGRVNLIGEHTDYNEGYVLPMAVDRWTALLAAPSPERTWLVWSQQMPVEPVSFSVESVPTPSGPRWGRYVQGVVARAIREGWPVPGLRVLVVSTVPVGGGLSSSAALEVATASLLEAATGRAWEPKQKAIVCQWAEHHYAEVPCGLMDQLTAVFGQAHRALLIDCRMERFRAVPFPEQQAVVLVMDSGVRHELAASEYARRRQQCQETVHILSHRYPHVWALRDVDEDLLQEAGSLLTEELFRRARHVATENRRTVRAAHALAEGDLKTVGQLMWASHQSLREDYEVSCRELNLLVELCAQAEGAVLGARMTGGGFGGCVVALVRKAEASDIAACVAEAYRRCCGRVAKTFLVQPVQGTTWLPLPGHTR
jgi:galactokinase